MATTPGNTTRATMCSGCSSRSGSPECGGAPSPFRKTSHPSSSESLERADAARTSAKIPFACRSIYWLLPDRRKFCEICRQKRASEVIYTTCGHKLVSAGILRETLKRAPTAPSPACGTVPALVAGLITCQLHPRSLESKPCILEGRCLQAAHQCSTLLQKTFKLVP